MIVVSSISTMTIKQEHISAKLTFFATSGLLDTSLPLLSTSSPFFSLLRVEMGMVREDLDTRKVKIGAMQKHRERNLWIDAPKNSF
jgi:hypothetical protein